MKVPQVNKIRGYNMTLYEEIKLMNVPVQQIRKLYGDIGADIFEGRKPTILSENEIKESKKLKNIIKAWWSGTETFDYEESDRLRDVILKYAHNKKAGLVNDIEKMFGQEGLSELKFMSKMGYIEI